MGNRAHAPPKVGSSGARAARGGMRDVGACQRDRGQGVRGMPLRHHPKGVSHWPLAGMPAVPTCNATRPQRRVGILSQRLERWG